MLTRKPRKGDVVRWPSGTTLIVERVVDSIAYGAGKHECFIWRFHEGLNTQATIVEEGAPEQAA